MLQIHQQESRRLACGSSQAYHGPMQRRSEEDNRLLFEEAPVLHSVLSLAVPTVISQLITVAYNMADTFFIGQVGDPDQVAAVSVCMPLFIFLTGLANLFGIGGASLLSRSLGAGDQDNAKRTASFSIWTAFTISLAYGIAVYFLQPAILPAIGADSDTYQFCRQYISWTVAIGAVPTVMNLVLSHLVRSEGNASEASFGMVMGAVLNIFLDPLFIFAFGMEVEGAALATMLSNLIAMLYFIRLILRKGKGTCIVLSPRHYSAGYGIPREVVLVGLPSSLMNLMSVFSNIVLNRLIVSYCNEALAGIGIAKKIDLLSFSVSTGISQGVLPLIGYNYSSGNYRRMLAAIRTTFIISLAVAAASTAFLFICAGPIVGSFIDDELTVQYGKYFQRVICLTGSCIAVTMTSITIFQAVGKKVQPLILSFLRKGVLDIPCMFIMNGLFGLDGIIWATPMADTGAMLVSLCLLIPFWRHLRKSIAEKI